MSEGETKILARLDEMDQRIEAVEARVYELGVLLKHSLQVIRGIDRRLGNVERRLAINGAVDA